MARAAGGTSQRLKPGGAMMRSRERNAANAGHDTSMSFRTQVAQTQTQDPGPSLNSEAA